MTTATGISTARHATKFAQLSPRDARFVLALAVVVGWLLVGITLSPWRTGFADAPSRGAGDVQLYLAEAQQIRDGQTYYEAARSELTSRGYPTASILNWRTPLPVWLEGALPRGWAQIILVIVSVVALGLAGHVVAKEWGMGRALLLLFCLSGALLPAVLDGPYIMPEVWCGAFVAASLACYGIDRPGCAVLLGLVALFVRELAAPYCAVCSLWALRERRWSEVRDWLLGGMAYATFYAWHLMEVVPLIQSYARAHDQGWLQFGGAAFVISLIQMNAYLLLLPQWVSAIYLVVALLGFASFANGWGIRAAWAACLYVLLFGVFGQPFNQYWGAVIAPLFCFGAAQGVAALVDAWRAARLPTTATWSSERGTI
jgi:hypothetical protein